MTTTISLGISRTKWSPRLYLLIFLGRAGDPPVHPDLQLVEREHVLPHDHRQPGARLEAAVRDQSRVQDGRPPDQLHLSHAHKHEQAKVIESEVNLWPWTTSEPDGTKEREDPALTPPFMRTWDDIWPG